MKVSRRDAIRERNLWNVNCDLDALKFDIRGSDYLAPFDCLQVPDKLLALADEVIKWDGASSLRSSAARRHGRSRREHL
jgi:hypothetical protein